MGRELQAIDRSAAESLIRWWIESGVEVAVGETPRAWLRGPGQPPAPSPAPVSAPKPPADLHAFQQWLASAPDLPMNRTGAIRVAPFGPEKPKLMLLFDQPDGTDAGAAAPVSGDAWVLAKRMIAAIGIAPDEAYAASLGCFYSPGARFGRDDLARCASIARDHVRLAQPERLILFGDAPARALFGEPLARARGRIHRVEGVRAVATFHPRWLLQRPSDKALAWRDLMLLMSEAD